MGVLAHTAPHAGAQPQTPREPTQTHQPFPGPGIATQSSSEGAPTHLSMMLLLNRRSQVTDLICSRSSCILQGDTSSPLTPCCSASGLLAGASSAEGLAELAGAPHGSPNRDRILDSACAPSLDLLLVQRMSSRRSRFSLGSWAGCKTLFLKTHQKAISWCAWLRWMGEGAGGTGAKFCFSVWRNSSRACRDGETWQPPAVNGLVGGV